MRSPAQVPSRIHCPVMCEAPVRLPLNIKPNSRSAESRAFCVKKRYGENKFGVHCSDPLDVHVDLGPLASLCRCLKSANPSVLTFSWLARSRSLTPRSNRSKAFSSARVSPSNEQSHPYQWNTRIRLTSRSVVPKSSGAERLRFALRSWWVSWNCANHSSNSRRRTSPRFSETKHCTSY